MDCWCLYLYIFIYNITLNFNITLKFDDNCYNMKTVKYEHLGLFGMNLCCHKVQRSFKISFWNTCSVIPKLGLK